jgi:hypothetical protein
MMGNGDVEWTQVRKGGKLVVSIESLLNYEKTHAKVRKGAL